MSVVHMMVIHVGCMVHMANQVGYMPIPWGCSTESKAQSHHFAEWVGHRLLHHPRYYIEGALGRTPHPVRPEEIGTVTVAATVAVEVGGSPHVGFGKNCKTCRRLVFVVVVDHDRSYHHHSIHRAGGSAPVVVVRAVETLQAA